MGSGPEVLLIHGTGASTHSWRTLAPLLARRFTVVAPDLPGHGFSQSVAKRPLSLPVLAESVSAMVRALALRPMLVVGHSAGAAILIRCALDGLLAPRGIVGINAALLPFRGAAGFLFPPLAKLMFLNPLAPTLIARSARNRDRVERLIRDTGSELDPAGVDLYARLFRSTAQVASVLSMMAHWDLRALGPELPSLRLPLLLLAGANDRAIAPAEAGQVSRSVAGSQVELLPGLGHLAHEEDATRVASRIEAFAGTLGG